MQKIDDTTWHIYAKEKCLYCNLTEEEFEEKWEMLKVMIDLLGGDYKVEDLNYERLAPKVGYGGPRKLLPQDEEHSY